MGYPVIKTAAELRKMAKTADYQSIRLECLRIDIGFDADIGITEYSVNLTPVVRGAERRRAATLHFFSSYKAAKAFIQNEIDKHGF